MTQLYPAFLSPEGTWPSRVRARVCGAASDDIQLDQTIIHACQLMARRAPSRGATRPRDASEYVSREAVRVVGVRA